MSLRDQIIEELIGTRREAAFTLLVDHLLDLGRPVRIVETGCARLQGNWGGDGQSTLIWDRLIERVGGAALSVDINEDHCATARRLAPNVRVICGDSIATLRGAPEILTADLVYLDSYDVTSNHSSALHHMGELAAIYDRLPSGALIAIDDCIDEWRGKHLLVAKFFQHIGVAPLLLSYVSIWRKP